MIYLQMILDSIERDRFGAMYHAYRNLMFSEARRLLPSAEDAEDAVHDAFIKLTKMISRIDEPVSAKTKHLVILVVRHVSIDHLRRRSRKKDCTVGRIARSVFRSGCRLGVTRLFSPSVSI